MSSDASRKKTAVSRMTIERAKGGDQHSRKGGGFIIEHHYDNSGAGESYRMPEKHVASSAKDLMKHVSTHMGDGEGMAEEKAEAKGTPAAKNNVSTAKSRTGTHKAPSAVTKGAGAD